MSLSSATILQQFTEPLMSIGSTAVRLLTVATISLGTLAAQQPANPSPNLAGIAHVALRVHDLDASVAFYEKLGFVRAFALSREGVVYEAFIKINDRQFIELYPATAKDPQIGFLHVCFEGKDLQSAHDYYVAQGVTPISVRTAGAGNLLFTMPGPATPTGPQNMEYTQYMPGSLHSKDVGQHLGADRIATEITSVAIPVDDPPAAAKFYAEKVGFVPSGKPSPARTHFNIPGAQGESIDLIPSTHDGFKAEITLNADPLKAAKILQQRGISSDAINLNTLTDPDGNHIILQSR
jgi:catechol 2,3-dioxygenase-like lactoylglutathione lyase family enzyme